MVVYKSISSPKACIVSLFLTTLASNRLLVSLSFLNDTACHHSDRVYCTCIALLCAGVTSYKGLKQTEARAGQFVTIIGAAGGLGHLAVQYAKAMGLRVIAVDVGKEKLEYCSQLGTYTFAAYIEQICRYLIVYDLST